MKFKLFLLILVWALVACTNNNYSFEPDEGDNQQTRCIYPDGDIVPVEPDYHNPVYWYGNPAEETDKAVDIFYVYPTLGTSPVDDGGNKLFYTNVDKQGERDAADGNQRFNKYVYAREDYNFYSPFYRQMTMEVYGMGRDAVKQKEGIPAYDIIRSFQYYMKHYNNGRPFILLGHSQGSQLLIGLLKYGMTAKQQKQMVAAYLIGYEITKTELALYPRRLKPAKGRDDIGVVILYNSLTAIDAKAPMLNNSAVCINPVNWKTDGTPATKEEHKGIVRYDAATDTYTTIPNYTGVYVQDHYLICTDVDPNECYMEALKNDFPFGCLHFMDSWLYAVNLKENMAVRVARYNELNR